MSQQGTKKGRVDASRTRRRWYVSRRPMPRGLIAAATLLAFAIAARVAAQDWPQFLGSDRTGVYRGPALSESWPAQGPKVVWRVPVGQGFSGPVVLQGRVILFHRVGNQEVVDAFDVKTGAAQWRYAYATTYRDDFGFDEGPRAVPVVASSIRMAPKDNSMPSTSRKARRSGASRPCAPSGYRRASLAPPVLR